MDERPHAEHERQPQIQRTITWGLLTFAGTAALTFWALWPQTGGSELGRWDIVSWQDEKTGRPQVVAPLGPWPVDAQILDEDGQLATGAKVFDTFIEIRADAPPPPYPNGPDEVIRATLALGVEADRPLLPKKWPITLHVADVHGELTPTHILQRTDRGQVSGLDMYLPWALLIGMATGAEAKLIFGATGEDGPVHEGPGVEINLGPHTGVQAHRLLVELNRRGLEFPTWGLDVKTRVPEPPPWSVASRAEATPAP